MLFNNFIECLGNIIRGLLLLCNSHTDNHGLALVFRCQFQRPVEGVCLFFWNKEVWGLNAKQVDI